VTLWRAIASPAPRRVVVHSPRPVDEVRGILEALVTGGRRPIPPRTGPRVRVVDGELDGATVTFTVVPVATNEAPSLEFSGTIDALADGSVLTGSIRAPMAFGLPAAGLTVLVVLFLLWSGIPIALVAIGAVAWVFLTLIIVAGLQEQRLRGAEAIQRLLEDALA
jgi:hypothetical protein